MFVDKMPIDISDNDFNHDNALIKNVPGFSKKRPTTKKVTIGELMGIGLLEIEIEENNHYIVVDSLPVRTSDLEFFADHEQFAHIQSGVYEVSRSNADFTPTVAEAMGAGVKKVETRDFQLKIDVFPKYVPLDTWLKNPFAYLNEEEVKGTFFPSMFPRFNTVDDMCGTTLKDHKNIVTFK